MCKKVRYFKSIKVSKLLKVSNPRVPPVIYKIFSFKTLQYWANAYSFRSMKQVKVFCRKNALKMSKIKLLNGYFH